MAKDGKKQSRDELLMEIGRCREEVKALRNERLSRLLPRIANPLIAAIAVVLIANQAQIAVSNHAGTNTTVNYDVSAKGEVSVGADDETLSAIKSLKWCHLVAVAGFFVGWAGIAYGKRQNSEKKRIIKRCQPERLAKELQIDPERTSSGLTPDGQTRPEDK